MSMHGAEGQGSTDGFSARIDRLELRDSRSMPMRLRYSAISAE